MALSTFFCQRG